MLDTDWKNKLGNNKHTKNFLSYFYQFPKKLTNGKDGGNTPLFELSFDEQICKADDPVYQNSKNKKYSASGDLPLEEDATHYIFRFRLYDHGAKKISKTVYALKISK